MPSWLLLILCFVVLILSTPLWVWVMSQNRRTALEALRGTLKYWAILIIPASVIGGIMFAIQWFNQR